MKVKVNVKSTKQPKKRKRELFGDELLKKRINGSRLRQLYYDEIKSCKLFMYALLFPAAIMIGMGIESCIEGKIDTAPLEFIIAAMFATQSMNWGEKMARIGDLFVQSEINDYMYELVTGKNVNGGNEDDNES